jgi:hypothetical protein
MKEITNKRLLLGSAGREEHNGHLLPGYVHFEFDERKIETTTVNGKRTYFLYNK